MNAYIPVSGKVFDHHEIDNATKAAQDGWWTEGEFAKKFEKRFQEFFPVKYVSLVNSGSSANLVALTALTSTVFGEKALKKGDEVITSAVAFPTTVNPIIQNGLTPVFVDADLGTKNPSIESIERAITGKTRAIMMAHTLGNPLPLAGIMHLVTKYNLWFVEDCCDALGSLYEGKKVGTFGHIATFSFYPAHHITMGEGGAVITNMSLIHKSIRQFRDWGRDCWCDTGKDNTCARRFGWQLGELPMGYDHKYIYSQIGYNLKLTDFQAAIGLAQMDKLSGFIEKRKENYETLFKGLSKFEKYLSFSTAEKDADPSWFGFMIMRKSDAPFTRNELVEYLEAHGIGTRMLFSGNLLRHPAYIERKDIRVVGALVNADDILANGFWIGVWPGITKTMTDTMISAFEEFFFRYEAKT